MKRKYWPYAFASEFLTLVVSVGLNIMMLTVITTFANVGYTAGSLPDAIIAQSDLGGNSELMKEILVEVGNAISIWFYQNQAWISPVWLEGVLWILSLSVYAVLIHWSWHRLLKPVYRDWRGFHETA